MKKKLIIAISTLLFISICISTAMIIHAKSNKLIGESWAIYFAPTSTRVLYGDDNAKVVEFDSHGNISSTSVKAYPFSSFVNYNDSLFYQTNDGVSSTKSKDKFNNLSIQNTVGYNMGDTLENKNLYYFLVNDSYKTGYYSSHLIVGNDEKQTLHELEGFIHSYGDDGENIYLLTSDMQDRYSLQIQKISTKDQHNITIEKNNIKFDYDLSGIGKIFIDNGYIYALSFKDQDSLTMLKISLSNLDLESMTDVLKFTPDMMTKAYYPVSPISVFRDNEKIYYPLFTGDTYSFNLLTNEFKKEFSIGNYTYNYDTNLLSSYSNKDSEIYFLYYEKDKNSFCVSTYSINGDFKSKLYLDNLSIKQGHYPHSFIKVD